MSSQIARKVLQTFQKLRKLAKEIEELSKREQEVLSYLVKGQTYKEIADKLFISVETVQTHVHKIYKKLYVRNSTEAALKYFQSF